MERNVNSIIRLPSATGVDLSDAEGKAVGIDATGAAVLGGDYGVVTAAYQGGVSVAVLGGNAGPVDVKLAGAVKAGDFLVRSPTLGTWTKAGDGDVAEARAIEGGASAELVAAVLLQPAAAVGEDVFSKPVAST